MIRLVGVLHITLQVVLNTLHNEPPEITTTQIVHYGETRAGNVPEWIVCHGLNCIFTKDGTIQTVLKVVRPRQEHGSL